MAQSPGKPAGDRIELSWLWPGRSVGSDPGCGPSRTSSWSRSALQRGKAAGLPLPRASPRSVPPCLSHQCWNLRTQSLRWGAKPSHLANVDATSPAPAARGPGVVRRLWTESEASTGPASEAGTRGGMLRECAVTSRPVGERALSWSTSSPVWNETEYDGQP